jgi:hypothetical protein
MPKIVEADFWVKKLRNEVKQKTNNSFYVSNCKGKIRIECKKNKQRIKGQTLKLPIFWHENNANEALELIVEIYNIFDNGIGTETLVKAFNIAKTSVVKYKEGFTERELDMIYYGLQEAVYRIETTAIGNEQVIGQDMAEHHLLIGKVLKQRWKE